MHGRNLLKLFMEKNKGFVMGSCSNDPENEDELDSEQLLRINELARLKVSQLLDSIKSRRFCRRIIAQMSDNNEKAGSSSGSQQSKGKGRKNKRKLADPSPQNPFDLPSSLTDFTQDESSPDKGSNSQRKPTVKEPPTSQWNDPLVHQLQGILIYKIHTIFNTAIQQLVDCGYTEAAAENAVTRFGLYRGGKDLASHIFNDALAVLKTGKHTQCTNDVQFGNLTDMVEYTMVEMVLVLVEVKPALSIAEAMWWFMVLDLDIVQACGVKGDLLSELKGLKIPIDNSSDPSIPSTAPQSPYPHTINFGSLSDKANNLKNSNGKETSEGSSSKSSGEQPKSVASILEETLASKGRKPLNKKELETLQKVFGNQLNLSDNKTNAGDVAVEKKMKSPSKLLAVQKKGSTSKSKGTKPTATSKVESSTSKLPNLSDVGIPYDKSSERFVPRDSKDEMILNLVSRVEKLQSEMQGWNDWANQKVMEATTRLSKDKNELKALRQEKEEAERVKQEKKMLEENAMKRLSEMQCALVNTSCQMEVANDTIKKLHEEQTALWTGMEMAKLHAVEVAVNYEEALEKEKKTLKQVQSSNEQKSLLQDVLKNYKQKVGELQQELSKAEKAENKIQAKLKEETTQKEEFLKQVVSLKYEQEQAEAATMAEEEMIKQQAESEMKKYEELIEVLGKEVSQLKLKSEGSRIADLKRGMDASYGVTGGHNANKLEETSGGKGMKRDNECVMCLSEERTVVFLPCAHEVLCPECNEIHEKEGMKECPTCRTPIVHRIPVRFSNQ
ncbi:RING/U-box superfamily protein [Euphorbia peplus]|nr:RING/U-box superfamily protein [Euphorbia peplus]